MHKYEPTEPPLLSFESAKVEIEGDLAKILIESSPIIFIREDNKWKLTSDLVVP
jgi:hypothetical protein